ncbi:MAG: hypothetical protein U0235_00305 [Polyangiaceae bacterium]
MKTKTFFALALLSLVAAYGCGQSSTSTDDDATPSDGETEDKLILGHGRIDTAAVVESTTMMLVTDLTGYGFLPVTPPVDVNLDPYNQSDPFAIAPGRFRDAFQKNLVKFDGIDGKSDWAADAASRWLDRMASGNYQIVDTSKPCDWNAPHTYLEIERATLLGQEHATCGGRMPNEDAMDVTLNFLIRGPAASATDEGAIRDGVDQATTKASAAFPYLAEMNGKL